jgi:hypothetical protein
VEAREPLASEAAPACLAAATRLHLSAVCEPLPPLAPARVTAAAGAVPEYTEGAAELGEVVPAGFTEGTGALGALGSGTRT